MFSRCLKKINEMKNNKRIKDFHVLSLLCQKFLRRIYINKQNYFLQKTFKFSVRFKKKITANQNV